MNNREKILLFTLAVACCAAPAAARNCREDFAHLGGYASPYAERMETVYSPPSAPPRRQPLELRDAKPKNSFLQTHHSVFRGITEEDNAAFIQMVQAANAGGDSPIKRAAILQSTVAKSLNDSIIKNKDRVNQILNLQKDLLWGKIKSDPLLSRHLIAKYSDFNTLKFAFNSSDKAIDQRLKSIFAEYNARYSAFLESLAKHEGWDDVAVGLAKNRENWHTLGIGSTPDQANIAARQSRILLDSNGMLNPHTFEEVRANVSRDLTAIEAERAWLEKKFSGVRGMFTGAEGVRILSAEASEVIRKAKPIGSGVYSVNAGVKKALETHFGIKLTHGDVAYFLGYVSKADAFSPDLYVAKRVEIPLDARRSGAVSADFKGQNARNLEETMRAMVSTRGFRLEEQLRAIRAGETSATKVLDAKKRNFYRAVEAVFGKSDPNYKKFIYFSGDDGIYLPSKEVGAEQKIALAQALGAKPDDLRLTYNLSRYADTGAEIPADKLSEYIVAAESVEKDLRKAMIERFPREVLHDSQIVVDLRPYASGEKSVGVFVGGKHSSSQEQEIRSWMESYLRNKPYRLDFVRALPASGR